MPRPRKKPMEVANTTKMCDIEAYTHNDKRRTNNPLVNLLQKAEAYQHNGTEMLWE